MEEELEALSAIYMNEIQVSHDVLDPSVACKVRMVIHPATAENADLQFVCATLELYLPKEYPEKELHIDILNPRGLSDQTLNSLLTALRTLSKDKVGEYIIYELIEKAKDFLTNENVPFGECCICLNRFKCDAKFSKIKCYHHFHDFCLFRYIIFSLKDFEQRKTEALENKQPWNEKENKVVCPICRMPFAYDLKALQAAPEPTVMEEGYTEVAEGKASRKKHDAVMERMAAIYKKQLAAGGIIDVEKERDKFLLPTAEDEDENESDNSTDDVQTDFVPVLSRQPPPSSTGCQPTERPKNQGKPMNRSKRGGGPRSMHVEGASTVEQQGTGLAHGDSGGSGKKSRARNAQKQSDNEVPDKQSDSEVPDNGGDGEVRRSYQSGHRRGRARGRGRSRNYPGSVS